MQNGSARLCKTFTCQPNESLLNKTRGYSVNILGMAAETPEEKYNRLCGVLQELTLNAYPNPERTGCPGSAAIEAYARRVFTEQETKGLPIEEHVQHRSPCYREFFTIRKQQKADARRPPSWIPWFRKKRLRKTLDKLEAAMESAARGK